MCLLYTTPTYPAIHVFRIEAKGSCTAPVAHQGRVWYSWMMNTPTQTGILYRRGQIWWMKYLDNGKQIDVSTKTPDRTTAHNLLHARIAKAERASSTR